MFNKLKKLLGTAEPAPQAAAPDTMLVNAYATCGEVPVPTFVHHLHGRRDLSDPELPEHLRGFIGYVISRGDGQMSYAKYHVMRHLQRTRQHWSLVVEADEMPAVSEWAARANALLFLPDGHVRDPQARVLVAADDGSSEAQAAVPYPPQALQRKARSDARAAVMGVPVPAHLPPVIAEPEVQLRKPAEVVGRALALFLVAIRAESIAGHESLGLAELRAHCPEGFAYLSPKEEAFLHAEVPDESEVVQMTWRYEALHVLQWALGLIDTLPDPTAVCDVPRVVQTIEQCTALGAAARLRPPAEILDALDLHYRLHWRVRQCELDGSAVPGGVMPSVVLERHYALNWLVRFEDADWDDVDTPT